MFSPHLLRIPNEILLKFTKFLEPISLLPLTEACFIGQLPLSQLTYRQVPLISGLFDRLPCYDTAIGCKTCDAQWLRHNLPQKLVRL
jgi:hypothetical protein